MSIFGTPGIPPPASVTQAHQVARESERKRRATEKQQEKEGDLVELSSSHPEAAVRAAKGNADEETAEDRREADHYEAPKPATATEKPALDVKG